jgi:hypothetical protein
MVGAFAMADSIFSVMNTHKYRYSRGHRRNLEILIAYSNSPQKMSSEDV